MIHTIELQKIIPSEVFYKLNKARKVEERWSDRITFDFSEEQLQTNDFKKGIQKIAVQLLPNDGDASLAIIFVKLNASKLLGYTEPRNPIRITPVHLNELNRKIESAKEIICNIVKDKTGIDITSFGRDFMVRRIDYAIDIITKKNRHSNEYIRLFHKADRGSFMSVAQHRNNYYASNNSKKKSARRTINLYNKTDYEKQKGNDAVADNLLRFEVQMGYRQIAQFANSRGLQNYELYKVDNNYTWLLQLSEQILKEYCNKISAPQPYYHLKTIRQLIKDSDLEDKDIRGIEKYLKDIAKSKSLWQLKKKHPNAIKLLKEKNINPVPLHSQIRDTISLKSIQTYIDEYFNPVTEPRALQTISNRRRKRKKGHRMMDVYC